MAKKEKTSVLPKIENVKQVAGNIAAIGIGSSVVKPNPDDDGTRPKIPPKFDPLGPISRKDILKADKVEAIKEVTIKK